MPSFKAGGKEWLVSLDVLKIADIRNELQWKGRPFDIAARDASQYEAITGDDVLATNCLWVMCREDAATAGLSEAQFKRLINGDVAEDAARALIEAVIDFSPSRQRALLRDLLAKYLAVQDAAVEAASERFAQAGSFEAMKAHAVAEVNAAIDKAMSRRMS